MRRGGRVDGTPYPHRQRWRVRITDPDGERRYRSFPTEDDARQFIAILKSENQRNTGAVLIGEAIGFYQRHLVAKGNRPSSTKETPRRLRRFFADKVETALLLLTRGTCERLYATLITTPYGKHGKLLAADSHRNYLLEARSFLRWCKEDKGWMDENPLEGVRGQGRRHHGKPQPRLDEARRWYARALELGRAGDPGAVAALMTLMMGMRASEVVSRVVRDLDDGGRVIWVEDAKTEAGNRPVEVPAPLQPLLRRLAQALKPGERLFPHWRDWVRHAVKRICAEVGIAEFTAHGMRGATSTLIVLARSGALDDAARVLGHERSSTTAQSYVDKNELEAARRRAGLQILDGGKGPRKAKRGR